jgi:hypothetical protein
MLANDPAGRGRLVPTSAASLVGCATLKTGRQGREYCISSNITLVNTLRMACDCWPFGASRHYARVLFFNPSRLRHLVPLALTTVAAPGRFSRI